MLRLPESPGTPPQAVTCHSLGHPAPGLLQLGALSPVRLLEAWLCGGRGSQRKYAGYTCSSKNRHDSRLGTWEEHVCLSQEECVWLFGFLGQGVTM